MSQPHNLRLHHIGYAVKAIEPMAATYIDRFGYEPVTGVIHDTAQTALVQFLKLPGEQTYLEFVAPDQPGSKLSAVVARGGGLNHLCYVVSRIEDAIEHLEARGMKLISVPKPAVAFANRRICWLLGADKTPIELVEPRDDKDLCVPGV